MEQATADRILSTLKATKEETVIMLKGKGNEVKESTRRRPDPSDQGSVESSRFLSSSLSKKLYQKRLAIDYLTNILRKGWNGVCTCCEGKQLTENRIVEQLTSLCVDCKGELEAEAKRRGEQIH